MYGPGGQMSYSRPNVALYAAGGLAAGMVTGVGAYYLYDSMYNARDSVSQWSTRRRTGGVNSFKDDDGWCLVPKAGGTREGQLMICEQCFMEYGACSKFDEQAGMSLTANLNQNDLFGSVWIPKDFQGPDVTIKISNVSSPAYHKSQLCLPSTKAEYAAHKTDKHILSLPTDLYIVLMQMQPQSPSASDTDGCKSIAKGFLALGLMIMGLHRNAW